LAKDAHYGDKFRVKPGHKLRLEKLDAGYKGHHETEEAAAVEIEHYRQKMAKMQSLLYAEKKRSVLIVLQALDAGGKDGTVNHVFSVLNPQGARVVGFKQPTAEELAHDFLWRVHPHVPIKGEIALFNRSHYEDVLVTRVHKLIDKETWVDRYKRIRDFEELLARNGTHILKFFLHISAAEQLARFAQRLDDPQRNWKISESDYAERAYWDGYIAAFEDAITATTAKRALVRDPVEPQMVPQPGRLADHRRYHGRPAYGISPAAGRSDGHPAQISRGREGGAPRQAEAEEAALAAERSTPDISFPGPGQGLMSNKGIS